MSAEPEKKILVVDDELDTRIFLLNLLKAGGFDTIAAGNKADGYRRAVEERPAVIILNMMMPAESGIQMYRNLKRDEILRKIPVIMLSTLDKTTFLKCHNLYGATQCEEFTLIDTFMENPPEADELIGAVRELSRKGNQHAAYTNPDIS